MRWKTERAGSAAAALRLARIRGETVNILAVDTATPVLSIAFSDGRSTWYFEADAGNRHSEIIIDTIDTLLSAASIQSKDVDMVACMKGPGSFTGLRIGYSVAKGLCLPFGIALATAGTLDCMAYFRRDWGGYVIPAVDARKHAYFTALFENGRRLTPDMDAGAARIADCIIEKRERAAAPEPHVLITGTDAALLYEELVPRVPAETLQLDICCAGTRRKGYAKELLALAPHHIEQTLSGPEYIRKSDAEIGAGPRIPCAH
ncbi:MAG: tRNA (adenosine(37)-N6)-threonylcarbamoyltransferase complex dimerization subunit type 1 TsaB [Treponema sp.]|jgi:tRNA threonylcarbamoyladenosine biosynthesis protein TsaB|nr:tRNA (adenosine(37)-N6)-threonylcarbamoyltransferase complex dimerization subunit type 1 TsaB [Treponema sp.]